MKNVFLFVSFLMLGLFCCLSFSAKAQTSVDKTVIKPKKFERLLSKENVVLLDVRTANEYDSSHLRNAINIDVKQSDFLKQVKALDSKKTYLLYCRTGKRSQAASALMKEYGFKKIYQLKGGIEAWRGAIE